MRVFVRVVGATAVLVPDFQTLGLIVPTFFSLYRCAIALGLAGSRGIKADLLISLVLGYLVAVALNLASIATLPVRPNPAPVSHPALRKEVLSRQSRPETAKSQLVCAGTEIRQAPGFDQRYLA